MVVMIGCSGKCVGDGLARAVAWDWAGLALSASDLARRAASRKPGAREPIDSHRVLVMARPIQPPPPTVFHQPPRVLSACDEVSQAQQAEKDQFQAHRRSPSPDYGAIQLLAEDQDGGGGYGRGNGYYAPSEQTLESTDPGVGPAT